MLNYIKFTNEILLLYINLSILTFIKVVLWARYRSLCETENGQYMRDGFLGRMSGPTGMVLMSYRTKKNELG